MLVTVACCVDTELPAGSLMFSDVRRGRFPSFANGDFEEKSTLTQTGMQVRVLSQP